MRVGSLSRVFGLGVLVVMGGLANADHATLGIDDREDAKTVQTADAPPERAGREAFVALCTSCHVLEEVTKFSGYYDEAQWRDVVLTMATYGIPFPPEQIPILVEYLNENFGRDAPRQ